MLARIKCFSSSIMEDKAYKIVRSRRVHQDSYRNGRVQERKLTERSLISWIQELNISRVHFRMSYQDRKRNKLFGDLLFLMTQMKSLTLQVLGHPLTLKTKKSMVTTLKRTMITPVIVFKDCLSLRMICNSRILKRSIWTCQSLV